MTGPTVPALGQLRVLPVTIMAAGLLLTLQLAELWTDVRLGPTGEAEAQALLEGLILPAAGPEAPGDRTDDTARAVADDHAADAAHAGDGDHGADAATHGGDHAGLAEAGLPLPDLLGTQNFSPAELEVLTELVKRREALETRERELGLREGLLQATENRLDGKIEELGSLRAEIEALVQQHDDQEEAELQSLVKIYETMKPKDAARILQELEMDVLMAIMERMKERSTAPVLAAMAPERAREVTSELARREQPRLPRG